METLTPLAAVILLFLAVGIGFIFVHLVAGKFIRPSKPDAEKKTVYECGEPTIGSAWIQFDLRFYVVALLFVIFDVEVAFFFPWAEVFGKAQAVASAVMPADDDMHGWLNYGQKALALIPNTPENAATRRDFAGMGDLSNVPEGSKQATIDKWKRAFHANEDVGRQLMWVSLAEIVVFFGVLLVGFAYLWRRGDLEWVRSTLAERPASGSAPPPPSNGVGPVAAPADGVLVGAGTPTTV
ncbi:MAG TPA: NADH-quinone oxidoreductase subunit A [Gemmataceae bacterium]|nr:NADH-quinone oxidoreductase subunit A [Gemmataceae bacterium]